MVEPLQAFRAVTPMRRSAGIRLGSDPARCAPLGLTCFALSIYYDNVFGIKIIRKGAWLSDNRESGDRQNNAGLHCLGPALFDGGG